MNNIIKTQMSLFHLSIMTGCALEPEKPIDELPLQSAPEILSAYYGLDKLPTLASIPCGTDVEDKNGMPVVFSVQIDNDTLSAEDFSVETSNGVMVTPVCATLQPAMEPLELRTVLLAGDFGTPTSPPVGVTVVNELTDVQGQSLKYVSTNLITHLNDGPSIVLAEYFPINTAGLEGECQDETQQIIQLTWNGGVSGPQGSDLGEPQRLGIHITLDDGQIIQPISLGDDDPDNHVLLCIDTDISVKLVSIDAGLFHDPGDDPNPYTSIEIH